MLCALCRHESRRQRNERVGLARRQCTPTTASLRPRLARLRLLPRMLPSFKPLQFGSLISFPACLVVGAASARSPSPRATPPCVRGRWCGRIPPLGRSLPEQCPRVSGICHACDRNRAGSTMPMWQHPAPIFAREPREAAARARALCFNLQKKLFQFT